MFSRSLTSRILKDAQAQGILGEDRPEGPASGQGASAYWGDKLASLVASGDLPEGLLHSLAWDAIGREAGSWVDPLFKGPAPVGELQGLGDRYRDLVLLGEGATARVFKAMDSLLQRQVAIKVLKDPDGPTLDEARAQAQVEHPNVCRIYEVGKGFLVMQLVDGPTLAGVASGLGMEEKVRIVRDIALGVHAAHQKGLIHLDLKLNNVLVETGEDGSLHPTIGDFGMVRGQTPDGSGACPMGTPPYTSPEQLAREVSQLGRATDVYALGVILYVLLSGRIPFEARDFDGLLAAMAQAPPVPLRQRSPEVPPDLARIVHRCMEKRPGDRYATARELAEDLDRFLRAEPVRAMGTSRLYRLSKWVRRNRKVQWVGALGLVLLVGTVIPLTRHAAFISQQADWDHHFQRIVEDLRGELDRIHRLPFHAIDAEVDQARGALKVIEQTLAKGGASAQGPGLMALGQAHLLLGAEETEAAAYFQKAWDGGYRTEAARSWLALALVAQYQTRLQDQAMEGDRAALLRKREEAIRRYLVPARSLLRGRGSTDQARLAHLVDLAETSVQGNARMEDRVRMARAYRAQFPSDLDAMFEEAEALVDQADDLAYKAARDSAVWPPECSSHVEPLRQQALDLLLEIRRVAPSHPRVYAALAGAFWTQDTCPTERTAPPSRLLGQARYWLDLGMRVSATDPHLVEGQARFLGSTAVVHRLERGLDPSPILQELRTLIQASEHPPSRRNLRALTFALLSYGSYCEAYGQSGLEAGLLGWNTLRNHEPGDDYVAPMGCHAGSMLLETGGDPTEILEAVAANRQASGVFNGHYRVLADLLLASYAHQTGGDPREALARAEATFGSLPANAALWPDEDMMILLRKAECLDSPAAWEALENRLSREPASPDGSGANQRYLQLIDAELAAARRRLETGRDPGPWLERAKAQETFFLKQPEVPGFMLMSRATRLYLQGRTPSGGIAELLEGLRLSDQACRTLGPMSPGDVAGDTRRRSRLGEICREGKGRSLRLRGEILLALAQAEPSPAARARRAREAAEAFRQALRANRNLQRSLLPLLEQARALTSEGPLARP
ncbi:serine/threonine-protein kinase [Mesoterricola silvestris]|uniref:Protein kinase domain-containing protein n=1 Tax=Mesoterricola silvestris TaxID=2927979 RepID=A0AA48KD51_9BACT|nr:serine/threonine-protein kinase [Mesoterricola silvestris]BDU74153.1 hypothetical protein METEAL_33270 [Mesoterricola silvestris]